MLVQLSSVRALPAEDQTSVPPLAARMYLPVGSECRLITLVDGKTVLPVWVAIIEVTDTGYVGQTVDHYGTDDFAIPQGTRFEFTADNVMEY